MNNYAQNWIRLGSLVLEAVRKAPGGRPEAIEG